MKQNKKLAMALGAMFCVLVMTLALLLPATLGKYKGNLNGYMDFNIGRFNAVLSQTSVIGDDGASAFVEYSMYDFKPGMNSKELDDTIDENTAATTKFTVSNGSSAADAAGVPLEYTIRIRTSNSLPLKYTLKSVVTPKTDSTEEVAEYYTIIPDPETIVSTLAEPRYEYQFGTADAATVAEGEEGTDDTDTTEPAVTYTEIKFRLDKSTAQDPVVYREHELIAEWSADAEDAQSKYMKEVEIVEIVVTVTSVNPSDDPSYVFPDNPITDAKAHGVVLMLPTEDLSAARYDYTIDLRSFADDGFVASGNTDKTALRGAFTLIMHNGFGQGLKNPPVSANYSIKLKIPAALVNATGNDAWQFGVFRTEDTGFEENLMTGATVTYLLHDILNDTYTSYTQESQIPAINEKDANKYMLYCVYELKLDEQNILNYMQHNTAGNYEIVLEKQSFTIRTNKVISVTDDIAFLNKLKVEINATFTADTSTGRPSEGEDGGDPDSGASE